MRSNRRRLTLTLLVLCAVALTGFSQVEGRSGLALLDDAYCFVKGNRADIQFEGNIVYTSSLDRNIWTVGADLQPHLSSLTASDVGGLDREPERSSNFPYALQSITGLGVSSLTFISANFVVSPNGEQVVYDALYPIPEYPDQERGLILADVTTKAELWHSNANFMWDAYWSVPVWSPDGSQFAYAHQDYQTSDEEIALVDSSGNERIVTDINHGHTFLVPVSLSWSPDSLRIAFVLLDKTWTIEAPYTRPQHEEPSELYVADVTSGTVSNLCVPAGGDIIWSPDGSALIYTSPQGLRFIDLNRGFYSDLPQTDHAVNILGWLAALK